MAPRFVKRTSDGSTIDVVEEEAEQADTTANAKKVVVVDSTGTAIGSTNPSYSTLTDGTNNLYLWGSGALTTSRAIHWRIKESKEFFVSHRFVDVADDAEVLIHIKTDATKSPHGMVSVESDGKCFVDFYENPTTSADGTGLTGLCMNREPDAPPVTTLFHTPTKSANGTILEY